jgi:peptide/nickel transport system substrate-binding protein
MALVLTCGTLFGCGRSGDRADAERAIELVVSSEPETLDPRHAVDSVSHRITRLVHAGLTRLDPDTLAPLPNMARAWTWQRDGSLRVEMRPGLHFHSGAPAGARGAGAPVRAWMDTRVSARSARVVEPIASVEQDGELALVIRLKGPHATLLSDLELPILRADEAASPPQPDGRLDGLGPYRVESVSPGEVRLVPASGGTAPARHALTIRTVRDENARALRLIAGRADAAVNVFSPTLLPALSREPHLAVTRRSGANLTYLLLRVDRPPFDRLEARRAVSRAIDRRAITEGLLAGAALPASGVLPPAIAPAGADRAPLVRDLEGARADVHAIGGLRLSLLTTPDRVRLSIARTIGQEIAESGAVVDIASLELGALLARLTAGDFDAAILNMPELTEPNVLRLFLHSSSIPPGGVNRGRVRDPVLDRLLDQGAATREPGARAEVYAELEARLRATDSFVPLWYEDQVAVTSARARGFSPSAEGRWLSIASQ